MGTLFATVLMFFALTADCYVIHMTPRDSAFTLKNTIFYYISGNYTVRAQEKFGNFEIREMRLNRDVWVVLYTKPEANKVASPVCDDEVKHIPQERIMKIYNNHTVKTSLDNSDKWTVENNTIVCFQVLQKASTSEWGSFKYKYEDSSTRLIVVESRQLLSAKSKTIAVWENQRCYPLRDGYSTVVDFQKHLKNATSLDRVLVTMKSTVSETKCTYVRVVDYRSYDRLYYKQVRRCDNSVVKTVSNFLQIITGQTPPNFLQDQWPLVLTNKSHVCFEYEAVETKIFKDDMLLRVSEFPYRHGVITNRSGIVVSPGYPLTPYKNNTSCSWTIKARPGERFQVKFGDTTSDCSNDYILLSGVEGGSRSKELLCGGSVTGQSFMSVSNELVVKFQTRVYKNLKGFLMNYKAIGCSLQTVVMPANSILLNRPIGYIPPGFVLRIGCKPGYVFPSKVAEVKLKCSTDNTWLGDIPFCVGYTVCSDTFTAPAGYVTSPGYPNPYPQNSSCTWTIRAKPGQHIHLTVEDIKSSCTNDYIILDGVQRIVMTKTVATTTPLPTTTTRTTAPTPMAATTAAKETTTAAGGAVRARRSAGQQKEYICGDTATAGMVYTSVDHTVTITFRSNVFQDIGYFKISFKALGCSASDLRKPSGAILRNPATFYPVHYRLSVGCSNGLSFPGGISRVVLVCNSKGTWTGKIPFCIRWRTDL